MSRDRLIEQLRQFVNDQTVAVGPVGNLNGIIETPDVGTVEFRNQEWYVGSVSSDTLLDYNGLWKAYTFERPGVEVISASSGKATYPNSGAPRLEGKAVFFSGIARTPNQSKALFRMRGEGTSISIYIGGTHIGSGADTLKVRPVLSAGDHHVLVIFHGGSKPVSVEASPEIEIVRSEPTPPPPSWVTYPTPFALDPELGTMVAQMEWDNASQASGWNLYKATATELGNTIEDEPEIDGDGLVTFILDTEVSLAEGDVLYTEYFALGTVLSAEADDDVTTIVVRPSFDSESDLALWVQLKVFLVGPFVSLVSLSNAGQPTVSYQDSAVKKNGVYLYAITSLSPFGQVESDFSSAAWLWTNDDIPPAGIDSVEEPEVVIEGFTITVRFVSPADPDFAGVRVYGPYPLDEAEEIDPPAAFSPAACVLTKYGIPLKNDQVQFRAKEDDPDSSYFIATFDQLGNEQKPEAYTIRRTGDLTTPAFGLIYDGPVDPIFGVNSSIKLEIDPEDVRNTDTTTVVILSVYPKTATVTAYVDRVPLTDTVQTIDGRDYPAIELIDDTDPVFNKYEVVLERILGETTEFIATSQGPDVDHPMRPFTVTYRMDEDPFPGLSGVHVEDGKVRPRVYATMDDDSKWIRLVLNADDTVLKTATRTAGVDTSDIDYNTLMLDWTWDYDLPIESVTPIRIDCSRDNVTWHEAIWFGSVQGPKFKTCAIKLSDTPTEDVYGNITHTLTLIVSPASATVEALLNDDDVTGDLVAGATDVTADNKTYTYDILQTAEALTFKITASKFGYYPTTAIYVIDPDVQPEVDSVSVNNLINPVTITAYCDDDCVGLRFVYIDDADGDARYPDTEIDVTIDKVAVKEVTISTGAHQVWAIEVRGKTDGPYEEWREVWQQKINAPYVAPIIKEQPTETEDTGTLSLVIVDPQVRVTDVEFYTQEGDASPSAWASDAFPYTVSVDLVEGKLSFIGYRVTGYDAEGTVRVLQEQVIAFSPGNYPFITDLTLTIAPLTGIPTIRWTGDSNTKSVKILLSTSAIPSDADVRSHADVFSSNLRFGSTVWSHSAAYATAGQTVYAAAWAYSQTGAGGLEAKVKAVTQIFYAPPAIPQGSVTMTENGGFEWQGQGPPGSQSCLWSVGINSIPDETTVRASGILVTGFGREFSGIGSSGSLSPGDTVYIRFIPYLGTSATGDEYPSVVLLGAYSNISESKTLKFTVDQLNLLYNGPGAITGKGYTLSYGGGYDVIVNPSVVAPTLGNVNGVMLAMNIVVPNNCLITKISSYLYLASSNATVSFGLIRVGATTVGNDSATNTGTYQLKHAFPNELTTGRSYIAAFTMIMGYPETNNATMAALDFYLEYTPADLKAVY